MEVASMGVFVSRHAEIIALVDFAAHVAG